MIDFTKLEVLSFDCYGTLIDWETGIIKAIKPSLKNENILVHDDIILELYAKFEAEIEQDDYIPYKEVLRKVVKMFNQSYATNIYINSLLNSFDSWEPFEDTVESLEKLKSRFKLVILSNVDNDLFNITSKKLGIQFYKVFTAEDIQAYKPSKKFFKYAIDNLGIDIKRIVHISQSLYHDVKPAKELGITTVWVNRRKDRKSFGATPFVKVDPDIEVSDLKSLVDLIFATNQQ